MSPQGELTLLIIAVLLVGSAFFAGSEVGFLAVGLTRARQLRDEGARAALYLGFLLRHRGLALAAILIGGTAMNYMADRLAVAYAIALHPIYGPIVAAVVMTAVVLVFCEVIPIQAAARRPERTALLAAIPVTIFAVLVSPVVVVCAGISRFLLRLGGIHAKTILPSVTEEHIIAMIEQGEEQGAIAPSERRMLRGVLEFGDYTVAQIMTPRPDMICVEERQTLGDALELGLEHRHSRLPVYAGSPDDISGVLHLKDLLPYALRDDLDNSVSEVARAAHHVPESLRADELLQQLQRERLMLAIVKDEYGGTAGLVTVEDLLEEIVGDIRDEYDVEEPEVIGVAPNEFLCDARVSLHELQTHLTHSELPTEDYESLGGLLQDITGHIPVVEERVSFNSLTLVVEQMKGKRLKRIRVIEGPRS